MPETPSSPGAPAPFSARTVNCPSCGHLTRYAPDNPHRPFCSARCRGVDLGAWAAEDYRVATPPASPDPLD